MFLVPGFDAPTGVCLARFVGPRVVFHALEREPGPRALSPKLHGDEDPVCCRERGPAHRRDPERACPIDLLHEFWAGRNRSIKGLENHQGPRAGRVWAQARGTPLPSPGLSPSLRGSTATPRFLQKEAVAARTPGPRQAAQPLRLEQGAVWTQPGSDPACHGPRHRRHRTRAAAGAGPSRGLPDRHLWGLPARSRGRPCGMRRHGGGGMAQSTRPRQGSGERVPSGRRASLQMTRHRPGERARPFPWDVTSDRVGQLFPRKPELAAP